MIGHAKKKQKKKEKKKREVKVELVSSLRERTTKLHPFSFNSIIEYAHNLSYLFESRQFNFSNQSKSK